MSHSLRIEPRSFEMGVLENSPVRMQSIKVELWHCPSGPPAADGPRRKHDIGALLDNHHFYNKTPIPGRPLVRTCIGEEIQYGFTEYVVAITGHHMMGVRDIHVLGVGYHLQKILS